MKKSNQPAVMTNIKSLLKRYLPKSIVQMIKKRRYVKAVQRSYQPEFDVIRCLIKPGDVVIDLGANFGWYTRFMAGIVEKEGTVFSIEPVPSNYEVLDYVIQSLQLENVQPLHYAISDSNGIQTMALPVFDSGEENLYEAKIVNDTPKDNIHVISVETRTLDSLFAESSPGIKFIKCDVEGHEFNCLKGAQKIIDHSHPAWQIEVWGDPDVLESPGHKTFQFMSQSGYNPYIYKDKVLCKRKKGEQDVNYFFLTENHVDQLTKNNTIIIK